MLKYREYLINLGLLFLVIFLFFIVFPYVSKFLIFLYDISKPLIISFGISYIFHDLVDKLELKKINRVISVIIIQLIIIIFLVLFCYIFFPIIYLEFSNLINKIPLLSVNLNNLFAKLNLNYDNIYFKNIILKLLNNLNVNNILNGLSKKTYLLLLPIISGYMLYDFNKIKYLIKKFTNKKIKCYNILREIDLELKKYIKGTFIVFIIFTFVSIILFLIIKLDYPVLMGFVIGLTNIIPIIGPYIGLIIVLLFTIRKSFNLVLKVTIIITLLQVIESYFLTPYIQSKIIKINPLVIIISFIFCSKLFGFIGIILSIPIIISIKIIYLNFKS